VTKITKHDAEQEGEGHTSKDCRVNFFVRGDTISVDDFLEDPGEFIISEQTRRFDVVVCDHHKVGYFNITVTLLDALDLAQKVRHV
jgi:hypothetical protein